MRRRSERGNLISKRNKKKKEKEKRKEGKKRKEKETTDYIERHKGDRGIKARLSRNRLFPRMLVTLVQFRYHFDS